MWTLRRLPFAQAPGWAEDDHLAALDAFSRHARRPRNETYRRGELGILPETLDDMAVEAGSEAARRDARAFFERSFDLFALTCTDSSRGRVTAFYEPEIAASRKRNGRFSVAFHWRPDDLVPVTAENRPEGWDPELRFALKEPGGSLRPYPDRRAINDGWLDGRDLEIAFVESEVDAFFAHVQGAARLRMEDGSLVRITYDGKSGHPFTAIGRLLVDRGEIEPERIGMDAIRIWLAAHPESARLLMEENRSYIFFRETSAGDPADGPVAAAKVPLTAGRSLAVDRLLHTFATPIFVSADDVSGSRLSRLMIAQDTGSAIVGPARGDLFMGSGDEAGRRAGNVNSPADFFILIPKSAEYADDIVVAP